MPGKRRGERITEIPAARTLHPLAHESNSIGRLDHCDTVLSLLQGDGQFGGLSLPELPATDQLRTDDIYHTRDIACRDYLEFVRVSAVLKLVCPNFFTG